MKLIKSLLTAVAALAITTPINAATWDEINHLATLVRGTSTEVSIENCPENLNGYYHYAPGQGIDKIGICKNNIDMENPDEVWDVLAHEATHVMQACHGGPVVKNEYVQQIQKELYENDPHDFTILHHYPKADKRKELEAFWMETNEPRVVLSWFKTFCGS